MFSFCEWKIDLDIKNQYAIVRSSCNNILGKVIKNFPVLEELFIDSFDDGIYVLLNQDKLESFEPFVYNGVSIPFELHRHGESGWSLWWDKHNRNRYDDLIIYDSIVNKSGIFNSAQNWIEGKSMRFHLIDNIKKCEMSLEQCRKDLEKSTKTKFNRTYYDIDFLKDRIESHENNLQKMNLFLDKSNKKIPCTKCSCFLDDNV